MSKLTPPVHAKDHQQGAENAPATLVMFGDYECPHCAEAHPVVKRLLRERGASLRLVFRHFPMNSVHPTASVAAMAAEAAGAQGVFWPMHDMLFAHQKDLAEMDLTHFALRLGCDLYKFNSDMSSEIHAPKVKADLNSGLRSGVTGTPTFFINGVRHDGPPAYESLLAAIAPAT